MRVTTGLGTLGHALGAICFARDGRAYLGKGDTPVLGNAPRACRELAQVEAGTGAVDDPEPVALKGAAWPAACRATSRFPTDGHTGGDRFVMPFRGAHFGMRHRWNNSWTGADSLASAPASGPLDLGAEGRDRGAGRGSRCR